MNDISRQPAGQPTGGQFAATSGSDAGVDLGAVETPAAARNLRALPPERMREQFLAETKMARENTARASRKVASQAISVIDALHSDQPILHVSPDARDVDTMNGHIREISHAGQGLSRAGGDADDLRFTVQIDGPDPKPLPEHDRAPWFRNEHDASDPVQTGRAYALHVVTEAASMANTNARATHARATLAYQEATSEQPEMGQLQEAAAITNDHSQMNAALTRLSLASDMAMRMGAAPDAVVAARRSGLS